MGHSVAKAVLASKLNQAMGIYLPALNSRGQRRSWESNVISSYNSMINNLSSMMSSVGFGTISEADRFNDPVGKKKTHDALAGALGTTFEKIEHYSLGSGNQEITSKKVTDAIALMKVTSLLFFGIVSIPIILFISLMESILIA